MEYIFILLAAFSVLMAVRLAWISRQWDKFYKSLHIWRDELVKTQDLNLLEKLNDISDHWPDWDKSVLRLTVWDFDRFWEGCNSYFELKAEHN